MGSRVRIRLVHLLRHPEESSISSFEKFCRDDWGQCFRSGSMVQIRVTAYELLTRGGGLFEVCYTPGL